MTTPNPLKVRVTYVSPHTLSRICAAGRRGRQGRRRAHWRIGRTPAPGAGANQGTVNACLQPTWEELLQTDEVSVELGALFSSVSLSHFHTTEENSELCEIAFCVVITNSNPTNWTSHIYNRRTSQPEEILTFI